MYLRLCVVVQFLQLACQVLQRLRVLRTRRGLRLLLLQRRDLHVQELDLRGVLQRRILLDGDQVEHVRAVIVALREGCLPLPDELRRCSLVRGERRGLLLVLLLALLLLPLFLLLHGAPLRVQPVQRVKRLLFSLGVIDRGGFCLRFQVLLLRLPVVVLLEEAVAQLHAVKNLFVLPDLLQLPVDVRKPRVVRLPRLLQRPDICLLRPRIVRPAVEIVRADDRLRRHQISGIPVHGFRVPQFPCLFQRLPVLLLRAGEIAGIRVLRRIGGILFHVRPLLHPVPVPQPDDERRHHRDHRCRYGYRDHFFDPLLPVGIREDLLDIDCRERIVVQVGGLAGEQQVFHLVTLLHGLVSRFREHVRELPLVHVLPYPPCVQSDDVPGAQLFLL